MYIILQNVYARNCTNFYFSLLLPMLNLNYINLKLTLHIKKNYNL